MVPGSECTLSTRLLDFVELNGECSEGQDASGWDGMGWDE